MNPLRQLEQDVLARGREGTRRLLQEELQPLSTALPMVCSHSQQPLAQTRWRSLQLDTRLRGCGHFWTRPGLTHLLRLCVLVENKDDPLLWN